MDGKNPVGHSQMLQIDAKRLLREKVHRDRITTKRIDRQQVKVLWLVSTQLALH